MITKKYADMIRMLVVSSCLAISAIPIPAFSEHDFNGIVVANGCSGFIVRFDTSLESDAAMVLTNGHCSFDGYPKPNEIRHNIPSKQIFKLRTKDGIRLRGTVQATHLLYSTMTGTDIALYQLSKTFNEMATELDVKAFTLARERPEIGSKIAIIAGLTARGISGQIYRCAIDNFVYQLKEAAWVFKDAIRYTSEGFNTTGGVSGSPVILASNGLVVGIHSTKNESGDLCTEGNPCEINEEGDTKVILGAAYAQQTYQIYTCVDAHNQIDLSLPSCCLAK